MIKSTRWFILFKLAEQGALHRPLFTSTTTLAKEFGCSQQTVSRWLKELYESGLIERKIGVRGEYLRLTRQGFSELLKIYGRLKLMMESSKPETVTLEGKVFTGLGEGAYYVTREGYMRQFVERLGYRPYPGTLNLRLTKPEFIALRRELEAYPGTYIEGFVDESRTYGGLKCFRCKVNDSVAGDVLVIERTHHDFSVLEVISPVCLRERLHLKENSTVRVKVFLTQEAWEVESSESMGG